MDNIKRIRCQECGRLLFEADLTLDLIIMCPKCGKKYIVDIYDNKIEIKEIMENK